MRGRISKAAREEFHPDRLMVKLKSEVRTGGARMAEAGLDAMRTMASAERPESPALAALSHLERAGRIKRVTPIRPSGTTFAGNAINIHRGETGETLGAAREGARPAGGVGAYFTLMNAARVEDSRTLAGYAMVEMERAEDIDALQNVLASDPTVASVSRVPIRYLLARRATAARRGPPAGSMWNLRKIKWAEALARSGVQNAGDVSVAVLDTGVDEDHPDLAGCIGSYVYEHPDRPRAGSRKDIVGHGTHVCGTIAALANNDLGINGICKTSLRAWKIFTDKPYLIKYDDGSAEYGYVVDDVMYLRAMLDCADDGVNVINLSIGGGGKPSDAETEVFEAAFEAGCIIVAAMGNERTEGSPTSYPAAVDGVIAVGSTTINDMVSRFSNRGGHIWVSAPGSTIWSTLPTYEGNDGYTAVKEGNAWKRGEEVARETYYDAWDGTSMAAPHVSAAVALYIANAGLQSTADMKAALAQTVEKVARMEGQAFHPDFGHGRLQLDDLIQHARAGRGP